MEMVNKLILRAKTFVKLYRLSRGTKYVYENWRIHLDRKRSAYILELYVENKGVYVEITTYPDMRSAMFIISLRIALFDEWKAEK